MILLVVVAPADSRTAAAVGSVRPMLWHEVAIAARMWGRRTGPAELTGGAMSADDAFDVTSSRTADGATLTVSGELDLSTGPELLDHLAIALFDNAVIDLDLGGVTFIDSSGLKMLLRMREVAMERGVVAYVSDASPSVRRLFDLTGTGELLERPA
ncbi:MAG: STAS domain-containing protein [Acidimicrobiales bacterium]